METTQPRTDTDLLITQAEAYENRAQQLRRNANRRQVAGPGTDREASADRLDAKARRLRELAAAPTVDEADGR